MPLGSGHPATNGGVQVYGSRTPQALSGQAVSNGDVLGHARKSSACSALTVVPSYTTEHTATGLLALTRERGMV